MARPKKIMRNARAFNSARRTREDSLHDEKEFIGRHRGLQNLADLHKGHAE